MNLMFIVFLIVIFLAISGFWAFVAEYIKIKKFTNNIIIGQYYKLSNHAYKDNPWLASYKVYAIIDVRKNDNGETWVQFRNYEMTHDRVLEKSSDVNYVSAEGLYKMGFKLDNDKEHYISLIKNFSE
jgi:hypothetical protein